MAGDFPELAGHSEVAAILGVARQRVNQLRAAYPKEFPRPVSELRCGPVWRADDIRTFAKWWPRKTGRPFKKE